MFNNKYLPLFQCDLNHKYLHFLLHKLHDHTVVLLSSLDILKPLKSIAF